MIESRLEIFHKINSHNIFFEGKELEKQKSLEIRVKKYHFKLINNTLGVIQIPIF
jgi:hypothetical protein